MYEVLSYAGYLGNCTSASPLHESNETGKEHLPIVLCIEVRCLLWGEPKTSLLCIQTKLSHNNYALNSETGTLCCSKHSITEVLLEMRCLQCSTCSHTCKMVNPALFISSMISSAYSTASGLIMASVLSTVTAGGSGKIGLSSIPSHLAWPVCPLLGSTVLCTFLVHV